ncbi:MAG: HNH endonuclease [Methylocella sp.]
MGTWSNTLLGDVQGQKYPGYGVCIYCGSDGGADGLRDEHIIPFALNGNAIIKEASCTTCEKKINPVDHLAKDVFWNYRLLIGAQTRNPKQRPNVLPATFETGDNEISRDLPIQDFRFVTALPIWGKAGFFRSAPIDASFPAETFFHVYHWMPPNITETLGIPNDDDLKVRSSFRANVELFARAIAKIAYCHTVIKYGLNGFRRLSLPNVILGECPAAAYFVGTPLTLPSPPLPDKVLHMVQHVNLTSNSGSLKLNLVYVRLFAHCAYKQHGMPIYHVITGAPKSS